MTIHEIARLAGVSTATVSRVFSHYPGINEELRAHVLEIARQNGYRPRISNKQKNVVIITPYDSIFPVQSCVDMLLMSLTQTLPARDFRLEILPVNNLERLESIQFCAAVAIGVEESDFPNWSSRFSVPLIIVDRELKTRDDNLFAVRSDEAGGMEMAINHLYSRGCRNIGCIIHGMPGTGNAAMRHAAICASLSKRGLPVNDQLVCFSGYGSEKYVELVGKMLKRGVDALFCPGGNAGIVTIYALSLYSKTVPGDISLVASELTFFSQYGVPPQTTITQNYPAVGEAVADIIESWLESKNPPRKTVLPYILVERESVR